MAIDKASNSERRYLSCGDIASAQDISFGDVDMTQWWGGWIRIRQMTALERTRLGVEMQGADGRMPEDIMIRLIRSCCVDQSGSPMFTDDHLEMLGRRHPDAVDHLSTAILKLSGMLKDEVESEKTQ